ncbi:hypothetical protein [Paenibacillus wynnii]|uniref:Aminoacyl-transfer RNA synthetases class-II family profile domain-containing protein n=1 Tax=Paenibacillus wynnii TaxID=268407 RepID=A0A098MCJ1_9BACL|nr:hypothetical protein [Paenibacillus wynnii]KGE19746.1 hypothetical protein PWYN_10645 [Paenibacillus wynnii]
MQSFLVNVPNGRTRNNGDLIRALNFASERISGMELQGDRIRVDTDADGEEELELIRDKVLGMIAKHGESACLDDQIAVQFHGPAAFTPYSAIYESGLVADYGNGIYALKQEAVQVLAFLDRVFMGWALELGAEEMSFPALLPVSVLEKTGYLRMSPQYTVMCCQPSEDMDELMKLHRAVQRGQTLPHLKDPDYALSPSACFHCYMDLEDKELDKPSVYTFRQQVARSEGRLNWGGYGRMRNYQVREIVFVGDGDFVLNSRNRIMKKAEQLASQLGLSGRLSVTFDPFIIPSLQKYKKIQLEEQSKYELQLDTAPHQSLAVASFNLHGSAFIDPFRIRVRQCEQPFTGCVGFGLERWVLALLAQFGCNLREWPFDILK